MLLVRTTAMQFTQLLPKHVNLQDLFSVGTKPKETIFENNNQTNSTLQLDNGFCQQNRAEHGQIKDWCPTEKMMVVPNCLQILFFWLCGYCIVIIKIKAMSLLGFRRDVVNAIFPKYSEESRSFSSYVGIRNM